MSTDAAAAARQIIEDLPKATKQYFAACIRGDFNTVNTFLGTGGMTPEQADEDGWTAAGRAAAKGRNGVVRVRFLFASCAPPRPLDPLYAAAAA